MSAFVPGGLDKYDVVFFLNTSGMPLEADGSAAATVHRQALQDYMENKHGGFVGTQLAADTYQHDSWPWYVDMIGANYLTASNDAPGAARWNPGVKHVILDRSNVPDPWVRPLERFYVFPRDVTTRDGFTLLLLAQDAKEVIPEQPSTWVHDMPGGGRMFYTAFGFDVRAFQDPVFITLLFNGIRWAAHRI